MYKASNLNLIDCSRNPAEINVRLVNVRKFKLTFEINNRELNGLCSHHLSVFDHIMFVYAL
jgi:hypothetical protein